MNVGKCKLVGKKAPNCSFGTGPRLMGPIRGKSAAGDKYLTFQKPGVFGNGSSFYQNDVTAPQNAGFKHGWERDDFEQNQYLEHVITKQ